MPLPSQQNISTQLHEYFTEAFFPFTSYKFFVQDSKTLIIQLVFPYFHPYEDEKTIFAKIIHIAWNLEKSKEFLGTLAKYGLSEVVYTEAIIGKAITKENSILITTTVIKAVIYQLGSNNISNWKKTNDSANNTYIKGLLNKIINSVNLKE